MTNRRLRAPKVPTKAEFAAAVKLRMELHGENVLDAAVGACDEFGIDPEAAAAVVGPALQKRLSVEGKKLHLLKKDGRRKRRA